jgi:hypothetical protein
LEISFKEISKLTGLLATKDPLAFQTVQAMGEGYGTPTEPVDLSDDSELDVWLKETDPALNEIERRLIHEANNQY